MNILLIGSGGREHALAWKLKQSSLCDSLFIAPGNAGTALCGTNLPVGITDFEALAKACKEHRIDMVLVGPEEPLVKGVTDFLTGVPGLENLKVIGPSKNASQLEGQLGFRQRIHDPPWDTYRRLRGIQRR